MFSLGKLLFPKLDRHQRKRRMDTIVLTLIVSLVLGGLVTVWILFSNRH